MENTLARYSERSAFMAKRWLLIWSCNNLNIHGLST